MTLTSEQGQTKKCLKQHLCTQEPGKGHQVQYALWKDSR